MRPSSTCPSRRSTAFVAQCDVVRRACEAEGRDPGDLTYSVALVACTGADESEVGRRAAAIGREPAELRENGVAGTPDEIRATIERWSDAGAERVYLQILDLADLDHLDSLAAAITG